MAISKRMKKRPNMDKEYHHRNTVQDYPESRPEVQVFFARGLIVSNADQFFNDAEAAFFGTELEERLDAEFNMSLPKLFNQVDLSREKVHRLYLYCSGN